MKVKLIVDGGKMAPGPAVAQQLGPMGINLGKVIEDVNAATKSFNGTKVPVELDVDPATKTYEITVFSPPMSELIKKELGVAKGSGEPHKVKVGNLAIEQAISIAKTKMPDLLAKDLKAAVKLVVGTCVSAGVLVESKEPAEIEIEIDSGTFDAEISEEKDEASPEKLKALADSFKNVQKKQEKQMKAEEAAAAEEEAKKAEATVSTSAEGGDSAAPKEEAKKEEAKK